MGNCNSQRQQNISFSKVKLKKEKNFFTRDNQPPTKCLTQVEMTKEMERYFKKFDLDQDGFLNKTQVEAMAKSIFNKQDKENCKVSYKQFLEEFMFQADEDRDQQISKEQFLKYLRTR